MQVEKHPNMARPDSCAMTRNSPCECDLSNDKSDRVKVPMHAIFAHACVNRMGDASAAPDRRRHRGDGSAMFDKREIDDRISFFVGALAQLVEQRTLNP